MIQIAQDIRFKLATVLIQMERLDEAALLSMCRYYRNAATAGVKNDSHLFL